MNRQPHAPHVFQRRSTRLAAPVRLCFGAIASLASLTAPSSVRAQALAPASVAGWSPTWADEFETAGLDNAKWTPEVTNNPANNERQAYLASQVAVSGGNMVITSTNQPSGNKAYRSGRVHSDYAQRHGRWEIRADLPTSKGLWPAIWLLPDTGQYAWPSQGEIDIMENRGTQPNLTSSAYHFGTNPPYFHDYRYSEQTTAQMGVSENYHTGFHTYAVEWDAKKIRFFVDDVNHWTLSNADTNGYLGNQTAPMRTMLNTAVGGDFLGDQQPDGTTVWPQQFLIDYVRIYQKNNDVIRFRNGDFEHDAGSLAFWSLEGDRVNTNNVSVDDEASQGAASLKLFGGFTGGSNTSGASQGITVAPGDTVHALAESFVRSQDALAGTNSVQLQIEFYNDFGAKTGSTSFLSEVTTTIATASTAKDQWRPHELKAVAPAGAVEARLALVFTQPAAGGGAIHIDDVQFINQRLSPPGDADGDGDVDSDDLGRLQEQFGTSTMLTADFDRDGDVDGADLLTWQQHLGTTAVSVSSTVAVPEPGAFAMAVIALARLSRAGTAAYAAPR